MDISEPKPGRLLGMGLVMVALVAACNTEVRATNTPTPESSPTPRPTRSVPTPDFSVPTRVPNPLTVSEVIATREAAGVMWPEIPLVLKENAVYLELYNEVGERVSSCSGGIVEGGILTAAHCLDIRDQEISMIGISQPQLEDGVVAYIDLKAATQWFGDPDQLYIFTEESSLPRGINADNLVPGWLPPASEEAVPAYSVGFGPVGDRPIGAVAVPLAHELRYNPMRVFSDEQYGRSEFDDNGAIVGGDSGSLIALGDGSVISIVSRGSEGEGFSPSLAADLVEKIRNR